MERRGELFNNKWSMSRVGMSTVAHGARCSVLGARSPETGLG